MIDGNPTGSQVVGFLKLIGYDAQLAPTGEPASGWPPSRPTSS